MTKMIRSLTKLSFKYSRCELGLQSVLPPILLSVISNPIPEQWKVLNIMHPRRRRHVREHGKMPSVVLVFIVIFAFLLLVGRADMEKKSCIPCRHRSGKEFCFPPTQLPPFSWDCSTLVETAKDSILWDCLMSGSDGPSCRLNSNNTCVWCAEPIYGLCVTPSVAESIGKLPMFDCESMHQ